MKSLTRLVFALATTFFSVGTQAAPTAPCSQPPKHFAGTRSHLSIQSGGHTRTFYINVPASYDQYYSSGKGAPLIVGFHGSTRNAQFFETQSQLSNPSLNPDHVAVYPQGRGDHWQGSPYAVKGVNDIQFTRDLLTYLAKNYCLDDSKFYATGHSNGGGFTNTIACWPGLSGSFAAFAPMSAAVYNGSTGPNGVCRPDHTKTPILEFHGKIDDVVPYYGGKAQAGWKVPPVVDWLQGWVRRNGCSDGKLASAPVYHNNGNVVRLVSPECRVEHYSFKYMQHAWACNSTHVPEGDFATPVEATAVALEFFRNRGRGL